MRWSIFVDSEKYFSVLFFSNILDFNVVTLVDKCDFVLWVNINGVTHVVNSLFGDK